MERFLLIPIFIVILAWPIWLLFGRRMIRTSRATILATSITPILLTIAAFIYAVLNQEAVQKPGLNAADICMQVGAGLVAAALISSVIFGYFRFYAQMGNSKGNRFW